MLYKGFLYSQNLVPNYSFEEIKTCPKGYNSLKYSKSWTNCVDYRDSPDLYNNCTNWNLGVPINITGVQQAHTGSGYVGIWCYYYDKKKSDFREFIQVKLNETLTKGQRYNIEFYINRSDHSKAAIDGFGLYLSNKRIRTKDFNEMFKYKPQISNKKGNVLNDSINWIKISDYYFANGDERYIVLGNFFKDGKNTIIFNSLPKKGKIIMAYYFIDDIKVAPVDSFGNEIILYPELLKGSDSKAQKEWHDIENLEIEKPVVLNNIYFSLNEATLQAESQTELTNLLNLLEDNPGIKIEIHGHTDNTGSDEYNQQLSEERAKAVVNYLIENGISEERLSYKGFGRSKPLTDNKTEEGMAKNRRVEFVVIEK